MDKPRPVKITREQLATFLRTPELVRAFEAYIKTLAELTPEEINALRVDAASAAAALSSLRSEAESDRQDAQMAHVAALSAQVEQLREMVSVSQTDALLLGLTSQISELRERPTGMKIKRTINDIITIPAGSSEANYAITPALASTDRALLNFNGSYSSAGAGGAMLLTSASNINFKFGSAVVADLIGRFTLLEFEQ